jgi:hypothetical protein
LVAIYTTELYALLRRNNITIRLPPEVPTGVARSFEILIPVLAVVLTLHPLNLIIESQFGMIIPEAIMSLVKPLVAASDTLPAILLSVLVCQILWFAGIHGALIVTGIMNPSGWRTCPSTRRHCRWHRHSTHLCTRFLGSLPVDWRRGLNLTAGIAVDSQQSRAPAHHRPYGHRSWPVQHQ